MTLPQILRSRTQIVLPLRRSIRAQTQYITFHPRCFTTALPQNGEPEPFAITLPPPLPPPPSPTPAAASPQIEESETPVTTPPPTSTTTSPQIGESETSVTTPPQNQEPETPSTTTKSGNNNPRGNANSVRLPVRRISSSASNTVYYMESTSAPRRLRVINEYKIVDQGCRIISVRNFMEACRSPDVVPGDAIMVCKAFVDPEDNSLKKKSFVITHYALAEERRWLGYHEDDEHISPIMKKLEIESIENDLGRYTVLNGNLRRLGIGLVEQNEDDQSQMTAIERFFPRRINDNMDIIKRGSNASHLVLEVNFGEFGSFSRVDAIEHILRQSTRLVGEYTRFFNILFSEIFHPPGSIWSGRVFKRMHYLFDKSALFAKGMLESPPESELVRIPTRYGGESRTMPFHEALWIYETSSSEALAKLQAFVNQSIGTEEDKAIAIAKNNSKLEKRIERNVKTIMASEGLALVPIRTMKGTEELNKVDSLNTVANQIDRVLRNSDWVLTSLGLHPRSERFARRSQKDVVREAKFPSGTLVIPAQLPAPTFPPSSSFPPGPTTGDIPGNKREYNTNSPTNYVKIGRVPNELGRPLPGGTIGRDFRRGNKGREPRERNAFGKQIPKPVISTAPKPPPGQSVREKMLVKEEERLKAMQGLGYSLMASDIEGGGATVEDVVEKDTSGSVSIWEGAGDMGGLTDESGLTPLKKGDMCELRLGTNSILAIYLRPSLHGQPTADFLSWNGEITLLPPTRVNFSIPSFISEESITDIINHHDQAYENSSLPPSNYYDIVLPRTEMVEILDKIRAFSNESRKLYAQAKSRFDKLYEEFALERDDTELTLFEATEEIFGAKHGDVELYTTHLALMEDGVRYMADKAVHRATSTFKVRSKHDVRMIEFVTEKVRTSTRQDDSPIRRGKFQRAQVDMFQEFVNKAKYLVDLNRENEKEDLTATSRGVKRIEIKDVVWDESDKLFIDYIKASILQYGSQAVPMDGLVPVILRAIERYEGELNPITAYQFCTEIGAWGRWENLALRQKNITFPGHGTSKLADEDQKRFCEINSPQGLDKMGLVDSMRHIRKNWGNMEVFCIDDASAHEIDDGISLERVNTNENWVHIHIANPTAWLPSNHWLSDLAFRRKQSLYLPEQVFPMLPPSLTERIGLGPNRGVMTISAKITMDGKILDTNVQAGFVRNVKRFTYDTVSKVLGKAKAIPLRIQVGNFPKADYKPTLAKLGQRQIEDLKTLSDIAIAFRKSRAKNNMIVVTTPTFDIDIYTGLKDYIHPVESQHPNLYRGYPSVRLTVDARLSQEGAGSANFLVSELMQLANSVAAKFCGAKNIAAPFRVMEYDHERKDCMASFKNEILPSRDEFGQVPVERGLKYMMLIGQTRINASPKPHRLMGLDDGYVRATSPLRRYSDMIAHYQIQSYLLGKEPRTHRQLTPFVSEMDRGERLSAFTMKESKRFWAAVGVRRILELGEPNLPKNLTFIMMDKTPYPSLGTGFVLELGMAGKLKFASQKEEMSVNIGDTVKVEAFAAMPGEKFVWFEFKGIAKRAENVL